MRASSQPGLFDDLPAAPRANATAASAAPTASEPAPADPDGGGWHPPVPPGGHTAETIRAYAHHILAEARAAATLPWGPRQLRSHTGLYPFLAEWLKNGEGDRLMAEFKAELDRLEAPDEQVAPNWRAKWAQAARE